MARKRKSKAKWNEEIARNVVQDYTNGIATEDIAQIYHVPEEAVIHYLSQYGRLYANTGTTPDKEAIEQAKILENLAEKTVGQPDVQRALRAGAQALTDKALPARSGKAWTRAEEELLLKMNELGYENAMIAKVLERTENSVAFRLDAQPKNQIKEEVRKAAMQSVRLRPVKKEVETVRWTEEEMRKLREMSQSGMDVLNIAAYFGKSVEETEKEMRRLERK